MIVTAYSRLLDEFRGKKVKKTQRRALERIRASADEFLAGGFERDELVVILPEGKVKTAYVTVAAACRTTDEPRDRRNRGDVGEGS